MEILRKLPLGITNLYDCRLIVQIAQQLSLLPMNKQVSKLLIHDQYVHVVTLAAYGSLNLYQSTSSNSI